MRISGYVHVSVLFIGFIIQSAVPVAQATVSDPPVTGVTAIGQPHRFVLNEGQWDERVLAASISSGLTMSFGKEGYRIAMRTGLCGSEMEASTTRYPGMRLIGLSPRSKLQGREASAPELRYLRGEGDRFVTHMLTQFRSIRYAQAWDGIDVDVSGGGGVLRHTLHVAAGADPKRAVLRFDHVTKEQLAGAVHGSPGTMIHLEERDGGVDVSLQGPPARKSFAVTIGYNYYWGGGGNETGGFGQVDRAGNVHLTGNTLSVDFPLLPSGGSYPAGYALIYASVLAGDGRSVIYSTVLEPSAQHTLNYSHEMVIGKHDRTILHLYADRVIRLMTPDAQFLPCYESGYAMLVLDSAGAIAYCTATPDSGRIAFWGLEAGADGTIYATTVTNRQPPYITPDAYQGSFGGGNDGVLLRFDPDSYQMNYATLLGGSGTDYLSSIAVDGCGSVAVMGVSSSGDYPVVNAAQPHMAGVMDLVFTRFAPDLQRVVYSTYLGGRSQEESNWFGSGMTGWGNMRSLRFDPEGKLYFVAGSASDDFPLRHPLQSGRLGINDLVVGTFSPSGELLFSSYFGGSHHEYSGEIDVDACGNMLLRGTSASPDLPLVNSLADSGYSFLSVIDTRSSELRFSSWLPIQDYYFNGNGWGSVILDGTLVYLTSSVWRLRAIPATPGYPNGGGNDSADVQIMRFEMPDLCSRKVFEDKSIRNGEIQVSLLGTDTLRIDLDRQTHAPPVVGAYGRVRNLSLLLATDSVVITLHVQDGLLPAPGTPPLRQVLPPLGPGDSLDVAWQLLPALGSIVPKSALLLSVSYPKGGECPSGDGFDGVIPVMYTRIPDAELRCALFLMPAFSVNHDTTRLGSDTMLVTLRISNLSDPTCYLRYAHLLLSGVPGVTLLSPHDSLVIPPPIPGRGSIELQWLIEVKSFPFGRPLPITAVLVDTFGLVVSTCELRSDIPGAFGSVCVLQISDPVRVRADDSTFVPDPVVASMRIYNPSDTLRPYWDLRLDLSSARHIRPAPGESLRRPDFTIDEDSSADFTWLLRISPPPNQTVTERVRVVYRTNSDTTEHSCSFDVRIIFQGAEISCTLSAPDTLHVDGTSGRWATDTVTVTAVVRNTGSLPQDPGSVRLTFDPDGVARLIDSPVQALGQLQSGKSDTVSWKMTLPLLPYIQALRLTATVTDRNGREVSSCKRSLQMDALAVSCLVTAPDSVRYNVANDTFDPAEFEVSASLENLSDTAYTGLRSLLDEGLFSRAELVAGEVAEQLRPELRPGERWDVSWRLHPLAGDQTQAQRFRVRFFFTPDIPPTLCEAQTIIGGAPRTVDLRCSTAGHDSVWTDMYYEILIPDPLQLQYTIRNEGTRTSASCSVAILPPPMLELIGGQDSIRVLPALAPGEFFSMEWSFRILSDRITPEPWVVRWQSDCEGLAPAADCTLMVTLVNRNPVGLVVTPWLLRFEAERGGPLPAAQDVHLWTGGGEEPQWTVAAQPPWLDAAPSAGSGHAVMTVGPNTTVLPVGMHADVLRLDVIPLSTGDIQVNYDIRTKLDVDVPIRRTSTIIGAIYPNPVASGGEVRLQLLADPGAVLHIELRDILGRLRHAADAVAVSGDGVVLHLPTLGIPAGTYLLTTRTAEEVSTSLLLILP